MSQGVVSLPRVFSSQEDIVRRHPAEVSRTFLHEIDFHTRIRRALEQRYGKQGVVTVPITFVFGSPDPVLHQDLSVKVESCDLYIPCSFGDLRGYPIYAQSYIEGGMLVVKKLHHSTPDSVFESSVFTASDGWTRVGPWHYTLPIDNAKKLGLIPE